jgi:creatinine amidohydrolase/Fe(II)-dependent formamide hydrolase-like protein
VMGDARRASADKGEALLAAIAGSCAGLLANTALWRDD